MEEVLMTTAKDFKVGEFVILKTGIYKGHYGKVVKVHNGHLEIEIQVDEPAGYYLPSHGEVEKL